MSNKKPCTGTIYIVSGKEWCVGEKKISKFNNKNKKKGTKKHKGTKYHKGKGTKKNKRKTLKMPTGGTYDKVKCCMCENKINKADTLIPRECLAKYGSRAHRICKDCWWDPEKGFAREDASHKCPGCIKGIPLEQQKKIFVDLTEDEDA
jgi:hypothetical protein